ncbi:unnamed protein product [Closterium sp. Yama58-4]|nr:unnamed protein product [Closterium sp. Yama58-4]
MVKKPPARKRGLPRAEHAARDNSADDNTSDKGDAEVVEHVEAHPVKKQRSGGKRVLGLDAPAPFRVDTVVQRRESLPIPRDVISPNGVKVKVPTKQLRGRGPVVEGFSTANIFDQYGDWTNLGPLDELHIQDKEELSSNIIDFHNILLSLRQPRLPDGRTWRVMPSSAYSYVCMEGGLYGGASAHTILDVDFLCIIIHTEVEDVRHWSLVVVTDPGRLLLSDEEYAKATPPTSVLFDSLNIHLDISVHIFNNLKVILGQALWHRQKDLTEEDLASRVARFACLEAPTHKIPRQTDDYDCGIYVCMYLHNLVMSSFASLEGGITFPKSPLAFRRETRTDMLALAEGTLIKALVDSGLAVPEENFRDADAELGDEDDIPEVVEGRLKQMAGSIAELRSWVNQYSVTVDGLQATVDSLKEALADRDAIISQMQQDVAALKKLCLPRAGFAGGSPEKAASSPAPPAGGHRTMAAQSQQPMHLDGFSARGVAAVGQLVTAPTPAPQGVEVHAVATGVQAADMRSHQPGISTAGPGGMVRAAEFGEGESERTACTGAQARSSMWTGVRFDTLSGKWHAAIGLEKGRSYSSPLGAYDSEVDAVEAYAAAALVLRKGWGPPRGHVMELRIEDRAILESMTHDQGTELLKAKAWHKWRSWRRELYPSAFLAETTGGRPLPSSAEPAAAEERARVQGQAAAAFRVKEGMPAADCQVTLQLCVRWLQRRV